MKLRYTSLIILIFEKKNNFNNSYNRKINGIYFEIEHPFNCSLNCIEKTGSNVMLFYGMIIVTQYIIKILKVK